MFTVPFIILLSVTSLNYASEEPSTFLNYPCEYLEKISTTLPEELKEEVNYIKSDEYSNDRIIRSLFFTGEPGTGKTTAARAVAYQLKDKYCPKFIPATNFTHQGRGSTTHFMRQTLRPFFETQDDKGNLIIIDECQELFSNADDPHYDTDSISREMAYCIDETKTNPHVVFLFTLNKSNTFSDPILSRMMGNTYYFKPLPQSAMEIAFNEKLKELNLLPCWQSNKEVKKMFNSMGNLDTRDIEALARICKRKVINDRTCNSLCLCSPTVKSAIEHISKDLVLKQEKKETETDFQQRERHFKEQSSLNARTLELQKASFMVNNWYEIWEAKQDKIKRSYDKLQDINTIWKE